MKAGLLPNLAEAPRRRAGSATWAPACRRRARSPGPTSSTAPGPARTGSSTSSTATPQEQCAPFYSAAETVPGEGAWEIGDHRLQLDFWPFNHKPPETVLRRQGDAVLGLPRRGGRAVDLLRPALQLPGQPVALRPPPLHLRHGHARHAGDLRHLSALRRGRPRTNRSTKAGRQAVALDLRGRDGQGRDRRAGRQPAQEPGADRRSTSSSTATATPTRP